MHADKTALLLAIAVLTSAQAAVDCAPANVYCIPSELAYSPGMTLYDDGGTYVLTQDLVSGGAGFTFGADNIILDGDGHRITHASGNGIFAYGRTGLTIRNLEITGAGGGGILFIMTNDSSIQSSRIGGIDLAESNRNTIVDNAVSGGLTLRHYNGDYSINTRDNLISGNTFSKTGPCDDTFHYSHGPNHNTFRDNIVTASGCEPGSDFFQIVWADAYA